MDEYDELLKELNREKNIKSDQEIQREQIRRSMTLSDTEGLTLTEENMQKLFSDLNNCRPKNGGIVLNGIFYEDFSHFASALIKKYFTKEVK